MNRVEHSKNLFQEAIDSVKDFSEKIELSMKAEEWDDVDALIIERNKVLGAAITPSLPEALHDEARLVLARVKQQDKVLMSEAKQRQLTAKDDLKKLKHGKKSIKSYLSGN